MADVSEARGKHERADDAAVRNGQVLDDKGNVRSGAESAAYVKKMFGKPPVKYEVEKIVYPDQKLKFIGHAFYAAGSKNGKPQLTEKRRVVCIYKKGKVVSGRWPEGVDMPSELKARIARATAGAAV